MISRLVLLDNLLSGDRLTDSEALALADFDDTAALVKAAGTIRDQHFGNIVTYSRKVFIPLTHLCRDVCHYCTFAQTPKHIPQPYMSVDQVLELCHQTQQYLQKFQ